MLNFRLSPSSKSFDENRERPAHWIVATCLKGGRGSHTVEAHLDFDLSEAHRSSQLKGQVHEVALGRVARWSVCW